MAPSRKSRSVNKRFANEVSPSKVAESDGKNRQKKRKLSNQLGDQWTKLELERFYQAYRKHGKDWKKVATVVRNRSPEMVEALYSMNKAYLSLPEGAASVVGLVAMMIDHYNVLGGSDTDREDDEGGGSKPKKRARGNYSNKGSDKVGVDSPPHTVGPSDGYLSLLNKSQSGIMPRAVRKRTPRVPFSYSEKDKEKSSPAKQKLSMGVAEDEVAHEIAMALTKASQSSDSPKVSGWGKRKQESDSPSPRQDGGRVGTGTEMTSSKIRSTSFHDGRRIPSFGVKEDNKEYLGPKSYSNVRKGSGAVEFQEKGNKRSVKKRDVESSSNDHLDSTKKTSNNKSQRKRSAAKRKIHTEIVDGTSTRTLSKGPQQRSTKSLFGDEDSPFDALQTLADMSLMMRSTTDVAESAEGKEEQFDGTNEKPAVSHTEEPASLSSQPGKTLPVIQESASGVQRRKQKSPMKIHEKETQAVPLLNDNQKIEAPNRSFNKDQRSPHNADSLLEQLVNPLGFTFSGPKSKRKMNESVILTAEVPSKEAKTGRKMDIDNPLTTKETKLSGRVSDYQSTMPAPLLRNGKQDLKERLSNCLSRRLVRRWCSYEWFYSAIDYPWFARSEFVEYLQHVALDHIPRLTRVEWNVIKGSLGRPRRFSEHFLKEERGKLNQYRESVRTHYAELRDGIREGLPTDLARPPSIAQRIVAIHPKTRELHNGTIIAVDHSQYRVQFDRPELGVECVMDIECMPLNPTESLPASVRKDNLKERQASEHLKQRKTCEAVTVVSRENLVNVKNHSVSPSSQDIDELLRCKEPPIESQIRTKEADVQAVSDLFRALDKKEAVVIELRYMNDALASDKDQENPLKDSESFKKLYAAVILRLNEVNDQVSSALLSLRERNTYQRISEPKKNPVTKLNDNSGRLSSVPHGTHNFQEIGSQVEKIVESSRIRAQRVVGVAMQAISNLEKMGETWETTEEAIDYVNDHLSVEIFDAPAVTKPTVVKPSSEQFPVAPSTELATTHTTDLQPNSPSDQNELKIPSELIAHCVATLLMIQKCTERQFPPAEVAQVLDSAVTSLQPLCSKNLSVYEEIQKYMGIIRTQILALIPT